MLPGIRHDARRRRAARCRTGARARWPRRSSSRSTSSSRATAGSAALLVLAFIFLYKLGDSMATALATPFYLDMGFTKTEIGVIAKNAGLWASVVGGLLGGLWMVKIGINRGLWLFGVVQLVSILGFAWLAYVNRPDKLLLGARHRLRGARRRARHRGVHRVHRARDRSALHRDAIRAVHEPGRGAAHAGQRDDRLDRRAHRLVRLLPVVHGAGAARHGTTLACGALEGTRTMTQLRSRSTEIQRDRASRSRLLQPDFGREGRAAARPAAARRSVARARPRLRPRRARAADHRALRRDRGRRRQFVADARRRARARRVDRRARQAASRRRRHPRIPGRSRDVPPVGDAGRRRHRRRHGGHLPAAEDLDQLRRLRADRRRLLARQAAPATISRCWAARPNTSTTRATCRRASTPG